MTSYSHRIVPLWPAKAVWPLVMFAAIIFSATTALAAAGSPAESFVQQNIDKGYAILNASLSDEQRRAQFRTFMLGLTDTRRIGMFTLGQYANGASKADLDAFNEAFLDYAVAVYESRLSKYKGQTLKVTGSSERAADDAVVNADVVNPNASNGQPFKVGFRVRKTSDGRPEVQGTEIQAQGVGETAAVVWIHQPSVRFELVEYAQCPADEEDASFVSVAGGCFMRVSGE